MRTQVWIIEDKNNHSFWLSTTDPDGEEDWTKYAYEIRVKSNQNISTEANIMRNVLANGDIRVEL